MARLHHFKSKTTNMSTRPSDKVFLDWVQNDKNQSKVQDALAANPALANIKDGVSIIKPIFFFRFSHFNFHCNTNGLISKLS